MKQDPPSSAPASAAGYFFQADRALLYLAEAVEGSIVGVEADDDVACRSSNQSLLEQDKFTTVDGNNPFSDYSHNLWNTLLIWIRFCQKNASVSAGYQFRMVTNASVPDCIARRISAANDEQSCTAVVNDLKAVAGITKSDALKSLCSQVLNADDQILRTIICGTQLLDSADGTHDEALDEKIVLALRLPSRIDSKVLLEGLKGWLHDTLLVQWRSGPAWVDFKAFNEQKHNLIAIQRRLRIMERPERDIFLSDDDRDSVRLDEFLQHLLLIDAPEDSVSDAIDAYLRFRIEYSRLITDGDLQEADWQHFFDRLRSRWRGIFRSESRDRTNRTAEIVGLRIFSGTCEAHHREMLAGAETSEPYLTSGAYQRLANDHGVHWHPDFEHPGKSQR